MPSTRRTVASVTQCASRTRKRRVPVSRRRLRGGAKSAKQKSKEAKAARRAKTLSHDDESTFLAGLPPKVPNPGSRENDGANAVDFYNSILKEADDALRAHNFDKSINGRLTPWSFSKKAYTPLEVFIQTEKCISKFGAKTLKKLYHGRQYQNAGKYFNYVNDARWDGLRKKHAIQGCTTRMKSPPWDSTV